MDFKKDVVDPNPANRDPLTKEPGSHPVGTGVGTAGGAAAGAAVGTLAGGPIGAVVGGAIGAVAGAVAGHAVGEAVNPTVEHQYWSKNFRKPTLLPCGQGVLGLRARLPARMGSRRTEGFRGEEVR